jgi:predicted DNA-binding transcriptional regulator AlpA
MKRHNTRRFKIAELEARLGVSRQTVWRWYSNGDFPKPHYLGAHRLWFAHEIEQWEEQVMLSHASRKKVSREGCDKQISEASSAESFYTMSGSSPPDVISNEEGGAA